MGLVARSYRMCLVFTEPIEYDRHLVIPRALEIASPLRREYCDTPNTVGCEHRNTVHRGRIPRFWVMHKLQEGRN